MSDDHQRAVLTEVSLGFQVRLCHRAFERALNITLARDRIASGYWQFLRALWQEDGRTQKRLSRLNNVSAPTTAVAISGMVRAGLVSRERDRADARKQIVFLTPRGWALRERLLPHAVRINAAASAGIPEEDIHTCLSVLKQITRNLYVEAAVADSRLEDEGACEGAHPPAPTPQRSAREKP